MCFPLEYTYFQMHSLVIYIFIHLSLIKITLSFFALSILCWTLVAEVSTRNPLHTETCRYEYKL
jgi:hypothetical protein